MNEPFEANDRLPPYEFSEAAFEALHARIGRSLDAGGCGASGASPDCGAAVGCAGE